jgi:penicillin-binding protein 1C
VQTTLDASFQLRVQTILDNRLKDLRNQGIDNGAALVADHVSGEILAWVNGGWTLDHVPASCIDAVITPRQPGSTLKPFLYALALEKGWTAATLVEDGPLVEPVGAGLHTYHNYSGGYYGPLRVREALGNSLNIPAVRIIRFLGVDTFLERLRTLGLESLREHPDFYGDGLALGNGEVPLLALVEAYATLARQGLYRPLKVLLDRAERPGTSRQAFSPEIASLIAHILSDPEARRLEFGQGNLLRFPVQTAVKTGTSGDYCDAWAIGFNHRYTAGVWMGNLDRRATHGITGSTGPALALRAIFAELNRWGVTQPLFLSPRLVKRRICRDTGLPADRDCPCYDEWFIPGTEPQPLKPMQKETRDFRLSRPTSHLRLALDPRVPDDQEAFLFELNQTPQNAKVQWLLDESLVATTSAGRFLWPMQRGNHTVRARIWLAGARHPAETPAVRFTVR